MHIRHLLIIAAVSTALAPAVSNAAPESAALKTCTAAFASSLSAKGVVSPAIKLQYSAGQASSLVAEYYARDYTFILKANDPKTGLPLASATCSATTSGTLLSLSATKDSRDPVLAAQL
jgi:hypothetical protein